MVRRGPPTFTHIRLNTNALLKVLDRTTAGPSRRRQRAMTVRVHYNAQNRLTVELCIPNVARMWMLGLPEVTDEVYQSTA
jgi:hypothetical protein